MRKTLRSPDYARLIELLTTARTDAGLTQQALADKLKKPQSFVAKVEGGERRIDVIEFIAIVRALQGDPVDFLSVLLHRIAKDGGKGR